MFQKFKTNAPGFYSSSCLVQVLKMFLWLSDLKTSGYWTVGTKSYAKVKEIRSWILFHPLLSFTIYKMIFA